jgi:alkaline phosphatase D
MLDLEKLNNAIRHEGGVSRRLFLAYSASLAALPSLSLQASAKTSKPKLSKNPFALGVASGDPTESGIVLWTRLAPDPLQPNGGMDPHNVEVAWEIASDDAMRNVVRRGTSPAAAKLAHSVHVEVDGLAADRWYWFRFRAGDAESPIGRTRTMPASDATPSELKIAFASCQHYETGLYTAYQHMAEEDLDLVLHLGDYIYETPGKADQVRKHAGNRCETLDGYRLRHSQYKSDPLLHNMHARCPWMVTWDDHDVANDYAGDRSLRENPDPAKFLLRRAAAYQAYYEMMPLRARSIPRGPDLQLYRSLSFGRLANLLMLDGRQYRSVQPNDDKGCDINEDCMSPKNTMLGKRQLDWVEYTLGDSQAGWNVLANQVIMALVDLKEGPERLFPMDEWSGYIAERNRLMQFVHDRQIANTVVLTGDNHANWVNDLRTDDLRVETPLVATEFGGTSISSGGDGDDGSSRAKHLLAENPGVHFYNRERGYVRCTITPKQWRTDFRTVAHVTKPGAPITTRASFVVEAGQGGAKPA